MNILESKGAYIGAKQRVFIAIPSYGGISAGTVYSLFGAKESLLDHGIESELHIFDGNCHVDDGRNRLVRDFLETKCTDFFFIDTDVRFDPADMVSLLNYSPDVVAGIYPLKQEPEEYPVRFIGNEIWSDDEGLIEVESVPTGFLRIKRQVFEQLYTTVPKFKAKQDSPNQIGIPLIFERTIEGSTRWGGDYEFCRKWRAQGGKIHIDPEMEFGHAGSMEWTGCVGNYLRRINGLTDEYIVSILKKIKAGTETPRDVNKLVKAWGNDWAVTADEMQAIIMLARENKGNVIETGSGITSLVMAAIGDTKGFNVVSLEHDWDWYAKIREFADRAQIRSLSLKLCPIENGWYMYKPEEKYSMALCDGPPRKIGDRTKFLDVDAFEDGAIMIVDDADTSDMTPFSEALDNFKIFGRYAIGRTK